MSPIVSFMQTRRSMPVAQLRAPGPDAAQLKTILEVGARVPDHGKLAPWRFIVISSQEGQALGKSLLAIAGQRNSDLDEERKQQELNRFTRAPVAVAVISTASDHPKIPEWEQVLSAGAVCMNILIAARGLDFGANWITEWVAYDREALDLLGIGTQEKVAGFIHIGTPALPYSERPRPDLEEITTFYKGA